MGSYNTLISYTIVCVMGSYNTLISYTIVCVMGSYNTLISYTIVCVMGSYNTLISYTIVCVMGSYNTLISYTIVCVMGSYNTLISYTIVCVMGSYTFLPLPCRCTASKQSSINHSTAIFYNESASMPRGLLTHWLNPTAKTVEDLIIRNENCTGPQCLLPCDTEQDVMCSDATQEAHM